MALIYYNGTVIIYPTAIIVSSCELKIADFPFDKKECVLKIGSWMYDSNYLNLTQLSDQAITSSFICI